MPSHFNKIFGWFDFDDIYREVVDKFGCCIFVEIGSFQGKSACYLAELIKESGKDIKLVCVDLFPTKDELRRFQDKGAGQGEECRLIMELPDSLLDTFVKNLQDAGVDDVVIPIKSDSHKAAELLDVFVDGKSPIKFIFVDAGHNYDTVKRDLEVWWPLLGSKGIIAGHDYYNDVQRAVDYFFAEKGEKVIRRGSSWYVNTENKNE